MFINPLQPPGLVNNVPIIQPTREKVEEVPRFINYLADYTGCGHWRMIWPEHALNAYRKCIIQSTTVMVTDPKYYHNVNTIRVQRQATQQQLQFLKYIKANIGCRIIYEIDDLCFREDLPMYNAFRKHFDSDVIRRTAQECMELADEMTVTCDYLKQYYKNKTNQNNITVIPNYMPRWWIGNIYDNKHISKLFDRHKKQPRIIYPGSTAHFDVRPTNREPDDLTHVLEAIVQSRKKYKWVFLGAAPLALKPLIKTGEIEFHKWSDLYNYPYSIMKLEPSAMIAPLADNIFNRCKSNLKYIEACALGLPIACQDLCTYEDAKFKFKTGKEMLAQLDKIFDTKKDYSKYSQQARAHAELLWLENESNLTKYEELYKYPYMSPKRHHLNKINDN